MRQTACAVFVLVLALTASAESSSTTPASGRIATSGTVTVQAGPEHPITAAQVREILQMTGGNDLKHQMMEGMLPMMQQMLPYMPDKVVDDFRHSLEMADFDAAMVRTFQAHLSTEDATQIIAFYKSPAGQRMIGVMPQIQNDWQEAGEALGQQVMLEVIQRHHTEIEAAKKKYEQDHAVSSPRS
jgi:hypothetical protein